MRHLRFLPLLFITAFLLTSCNIYQLLPRPDLNLYVLGGSSTDEAATDRLSDIMIGTTVEINKDTRAVIRTIYSIPEIVIGASARAGSIGINLTDYSIAYFNPQGEQIEGVDNPSTGTINLNVRPGIVCPSTPESQCTINSPDATYAQGREELSTSFSSLEEDVLGAFVSLGEGSYIEITVSGLDSNGNSYSQTLSPLRVYFRLIGTVEIDPNEE
jgi:hypothetical protein